MLRRRSHKNDSLRQVSFGAVGLIQGKLTEIFVASDIAEKVSDVMVEEISGTCPQHFTMIAIFGDTSSVETAVNAISKAFR